MLWFIRNIFLSSEWPNMFLIYIWPLSIVPGVQFLEFSKWGEPHSTFSYVNEVDFRPHRCMRLVARRPNQSEVGTFSPSSWPPGRREGLEDESASSGQGFNQSWLCNKASMKTQRASGLVSTWRFGESGTPGEDVDVPCPLPIPCPMHLFYLAFYSQPIIQ